MDKKDFSILLVSTIIAAFFGAFIASFIAFGGLRPHQPGVPPFVGERHRPPVPEEFENMMEHQEKVTERDMKFFDKFDKDMEDLVEKSTRPAGFIQMSTYGMTREGNPQEDKIFVDLKPFNGDPTNVLIKVQGKTIKIFAGFESADKLNFHSSQFYQSITLDHEIDKKTIKKEVKDDTLVITIPKK